MSGQRCFFCEAAVVADTCVSCGVSASAPRRACDGCQRVILAAAPACPHCAHVRSNEMWWKIPLIVAMFLAVFIISVIAGMLV
jgi:RNA polymerase subunit RPABC4/transcription elongation factor Spt4